MGLQRGALGGGIIGIFMVLIFVLMLTLLIDVATKGKVSKAVSSECPFKTFEAFVDQAESERICSVYQYEDTLVDWELDIEPCGTGTFYYGTRYRGWEANVFPVDGGEWYDPKCIDCVKEVRGRYRVKGVMTRVGTRDVTIAYAELTPVPTRIVEQEEVPGPWHFHIEGVGEAEHSILVLPPESILEEGEEEL